MQDHERYWSPPGGVSTARSSRRSAIGRSRGRRTPAGTHAPGWRERAPATRSAGRPSIAAEGAARVTPDRVAAITCARPRAETRPTRRRSKSVRPSIGEPAQRRGGPRVAAVLTCAAVVVLLEVLASGFGERRGAPFAPSVGSVPGYGTSSTRATVPPGPDGAPRGEVVLAFAGDMHFERHLAGLLDEPRGALGPIAETLSAADLTMVNLESAITTRGEPEAKELEAPSQALPLPHLPGRAGRPRRGGIDWSRWRTTTVPTSGRSASRTLSAAIRTSPIPVIGIGRDQDAAFAPYRVSIRGTDLAFLAADGSMREGASDVWAAGPDNPGVAAAHSSAPAPFSRAVRAASGPTTSWSSTCTGGRSCRAARPAQQRATARRWPRRAPTSSSAPTRTSRSGPDGWATPTSTTASGTSSGTTTDDPESGVLQVRIEDGAVVDDAWIPAEIQPDGRPVPLDRRGRGRRRGATGAGSATAPGLLRRPAAVTHGLDRCRASSSF